MSRRHIFSKVPPPYRKDLKLRCNLLVHYYFQTNFDKCEAMRLAGYKGNVHGYAQDTFKHPYVVAEIERQRKKMLDKFDLSREWIVQRLMTLADSNIVLGKFKKIDEDGSLYWDFTGATPEELSIINGITTDTYTEGRGPSKKKVKKFGLVITDPKAALDSLARIQGLFNDKVTVQGEISIMDRLNKGRERASAEKVEEPKDV